MTRGSKERRVHTDLLRRALALALVGSTTLAATAVAQDVPPVPPEAATPPATPPPAATPAQPADGGGYAPPPPPTYGTGAYGGYGTYGGGTYGGGGYGYPAAGYGYPGYPPASYGPVRRELSYEEGMPIPPGARVVERDRPGLWLTGSIVFGSLYLLSVLAASSEAGSDLDPLWIPFVGPWLALSNVPRDVRPSLVVDGIGQIVGAVLIVLGLAWKRKVLVIDGEVGRRAFRVEPSTFGGRGLGVGLTVM